LYPERHEMCPSGLLETGTPGSTKQSQQVYTLIWLGKNDRLMLSAWYFFVSKKQRKAVPQHTMEAKRKYSSYSFMTSTLDGGEWSVPRPTRALPVGKWSCMWGTKSLSTVHSPH
jgi:hypothetical protein